MKKSSPYGIPLEELARLAGVHPDTARRWKRAQRIPAPYDWIVDLRNRCDIGELDSAWSGWSLRKGALVSPDGYCCTPGQVIAIPIQLARISALELELATPRQLELLLSLKI